MNTTLLPLAEIFRLNTELLRGCINGMTDEQVGRRIGNRTNNMGFITLHVVDARFHLASLLGAPVKSPYTEKFEASKRVEDMKDLPPLEELKKEWNTVSSALMHALQSTGDEELSRSSPARFPINDASMLGTITFLAQHESYHIGQLGFLRKELGFDAVGWGEK